MAETTLSLCAAIALGLTLLVRVTHAISDELSELVDLHRARRTNR